MKMDERCSYGSSLSEPPAGTMADFNDAEFRPYLADLDLSEAQKGELLQTLWNIMRMWVEMDLPLDSCGQIIEAMIDPAPGDSGDVQ